MKLPTRKIKLVPIPNYQASKSVLIEKRNKEISQKKFITNLRRAMIKKNACLACRLHCKEP
jgi:aldehyde:ferredoxin oxidoreductase